ncbi:HNH endonuclease [Caballeronia novacaledonica]|uniref:HNH endonuclease n=1 Tax=Caballeronia novacaledonica TaxID=1544861 RepID=A0ACB5R4F6_9BURK|nr:HNH endonuclease [Caballeronia novacaledonica]
MSRYTNRTRGRAWTAIRERQLRRFPLCAMCEAQGLLTQAAEVDHRVPLAHGGTDHEDNLQSLCIECHAKKTLEEQGKRRAGCDANGLPLDDAHPWFK